MLGKSLSASVLQIWFPAHWAVRVATRLRVLAGTVPEFRAEHASSDVPNVRCGVRLPGQSLDVEHLLQHFPAVFRGIVRGVFRQQAGGAWFLCKDLKLHITVLMPQSSEPHHWFAAVAGREGSWPMELPNPRPLLRPITLRAFTRMRHRSLLPWGNLDPDWRAGLAWLYLETPTVETEQQIRAKFDARDRIDLSEREALKPGWQAAKAELARLRGWTPPTLDLRVQAFLDSVLTRDSERCNIRSQVLKEHVNLAVWRDRYGRLWQRKPGA